jgi:hypothetical protein
LNCDPCGIFRVRYSGSHLRAKLLSDWLVGCVLRTGLRQGYLGLGLRWTFMCPQCVGSDADRTSYAYSLPPNCSMIDSASINGIALSVSPFVCIERPAVRPTARGQTIDLEVTLLQCVDMVHDTSLKLSDMSRTSHSVSVRRRR